MRDKKLDVPKWNVPDKPAYSKDATIPTIYEVQTMCNELQEKLSKNADIVALAERIIAVYEDAKTKDYINKPLAYAIYQVWKEVDAKEAGRWRKMFSSEDWHTLKCKDCAMYEKTGNKRGSCTLRCRAGEYQDTRYGSTPACKRFVRREETDNGV